VDFGPVICFILPIHKVHATGGGASTPHMGGSARRVSVCRILTEQEKRLMKIAPLTERWNEGERDWSFVKNPRSDIERWECEESIRLPEDYREFMLRFNGGYVYPRIFRHNVPNKQMPLASNELTVDPIYDWRTVESHWRGDTYGDSLPPGYIAFAGTPGSLELLMGLHAPNRGKIFSWVQHGSSWATDGNVHIHPQADSFTEFLGSLFDDEDRTDYDGWHLPMYDKLAKDLEIRGQISEAERSTKAPPSDGP
jgi:hypothetical protein